MAEASTATHITTEEHVVIQAAFEEMLTHIKSELDETDQRNVWLAYEMALDAHSHQRRKSGEPYILHPIAVAKICAEEIGLGPTAIVAAILHDVVEDTDITLKDISKTFGGRIAKMVDGLTKLDSAYNAGSAQAENFRKVLSTLVEDVRVVLIKMADRLHNMRTLGSMPRHKQLKIAAETSFVYAPLAHRLGLYNFRTEFLDLCMKITDRENYNLIARKLQETKQDRTDFINGFIDPLRDKLDDLKVPYRIFGRAKSIYSIYNKIKTKNVPFEEIYDLFAVRIIVDVPVAQERMICWQIYSIVTDVHHPIPERLKDWIAVPKSNGYESLHTTVVSPRGKYVEVQIRSERMDEIAEKGFAAHWKYKGVTRNDDIFERWLDTVRETMEDPHVDAVEFLHDFKANTLFNEEVYVFTPNGDMKMLPKGATALDFAFYIHSDVGYHCSAIKLNNKLVPMGKKLQNGDQIQVITNKNQKPSEDWLKMVVTGKAKNKIRSAVKEERRQQGEIGKESLERKCRNSKIAFEETVEILVKHYNYNSPVDLYYDIAHGKLTIPQIFKDFKAVDGKIQEVVREVEVKEAVGTPESGPKRARKDKVQKGVRLLINGEPGNKYSYSLASCCKPVQGDPVFAYLTATAGLKIHRSNCPNATNLMANFGYRILKAEWITSTNTTFVADLVITGVDDGPGVIERLTGALSRVLGINIRSFSISGEEGYYEGKVSVMVKSIDQLNHAIYTLQNLDNVSTVTRVE